MLLQSKSASLLSLRVSHHLTFSVRMFPTGHEPVEVHDLHSEISRSRLRGGSRNMPYQLISRTELKGPK